MPLIEIRARVFERQVVRVRRHPGDAGGIVPGLAQRVLNRRVDKATDLTPERELHRMPDQLAGRLDLADDATRPIGSRVEQRRQRRVHVARQELMETAIPDVGDARARRLRELALEADAVLHRRRQLDARRQLHDARRLGREALAGCEGIGIAWIRDHVPELANPVVAHQILNGPGASPVVEHARAAADHGSSISIRRERKRSTIAAKPGGTSGNHLAVASVGIVPAR